MSASAVGLIAVGLPALIIGGLLMWWPLVQRAFLLALIAGLAFLGITGAAADIGTRVSVYLPNGIIVAPAPAT